MTAASKKYFRVEHSELVYLKFILEAYEGLSNLSTWDNRARIVEISYPPCFAADMEGILSALAGEISLTEVAGQRTSCDIEKP